MNQPYNPPPPSPIPLSPQADPNAQWKASRAFGAFAAVGLLVALWLPWFHVAAYLVADPTQQLTAKGGFAPVSVSAWEVSTPLSLAITIAAFIALVVAAIGPLDWDGRWLESAMFAYWLAAVLGCLTVCALAFGVVPIPTSITERCLAQAPLGGTETACAAGAVVKSKLMFGAGISVVLSLLLVATAAWGTIRQPLGDAPEED